MTKYKDIPLNPLTSRSEFIALLGAAFQVGSYRFARQITLTWLAYYPGDLPVRLKHGQLLVNIGKLDQAVQHLTELCQADPEYLKAWELLAVALQRMSKSPAASEHAFFLADCHSGIHALGGNASAAAPLPAWANGIRLSRQALVQGDLQLAEEHLNQVMVVDPMPPLLGVSHLEILKESPLPAQAIQNLADFYCQRFPTTVAPVLFLAESLMDGGEPEKAVSLLHKGATMDVTGRIAQRIWGTENPYENIWPERLEAPLDIPIPADVAALLGRNRLPQNASPSTYISKHEEDIIGESAIFMAAEDNHPPSPILPSVIELGEPKFPLPPGLRSSQISRSDKPVPESLLSIQAELEKVASKLNKKSIAHNDGRFPIYVIFTTRKGLEKQYGSQLFSTIDQQMRRVVQSIAARRDWGAILIYADDPECVSAYGLTPARSDDPWSLKLILADLDSSLAKKGAMIGTVLIIGGPEVVPFHNLPNPVDDVDVEVPSDNPYGTRDENYFVPEWPVGRLPGGFQQDAIPLIEALQRIAEHHAQLTKRRNWLQRWWERIRLRRLFSTNGKKASWGYTAAIWRRASLSVFRPIGEPHTMYVSPPVHADGGFIENNKNGSFTNAKMGYFNLHGLQDSSSWYGQRDPSEPEELELPDYPIALRPKDIGPAPQVVFSEACYGAHIAEKKVEEAISLKFLDSGSQTVVGSTCTSYGSITTPLIAADLLGHAFWKFLREGLPAGEALRRAKIHLAKEMHRRQSYLDGEDQKTLISFILIGDPLAQLTGTASRSKTILRSRRAPTPERTVCDRHGNCHVECNVADQSLQDSPPIPSKTLVQVKTFVEQYLPGMTDAKMKFARAHANCSGEGHSCPTSANNPKTGPQEFVEHNVVTLSKQVKKTNPQSGAVHTHYHYARLTIDQKGKVVKMAVSR